ncbi:transposase, Ptta/En/Spm, plant [Spatholobus suberectus]|nr:transposase, Ptta/En/Spm, plant [Spatholobus suberectus]
MLERLQEQQDQNDRENFQDQHHQQSVNNQDNDQFANINTANDSFNDTLDPSLSPDRAHQSQQKEEPLLVKVRDTCLGEITIRKMVANQVWHLEKTKKVIVKINGNGQGNDNGSNLLVRLRCHYFYPNKSKKDILTNCPLGVDSTDWTAFMYHYKNDQMKKQCEQNATNCKKLKVSHGGGSRSNARMGRDMELQLGRLVCQSEIILPTLLKKDGNYDKISEHLLEDQERAATLGVPSKVNAYPDDVIGKVYGAEHLG